LYDRGENGISFRGITGYVIIEVDGKYVMVEMLLSEVPFGVVEHSDDVILRERNQELTGYGVEEYEWSFTEPSNSSTEAFAFWTHLSWLCENSWEMSLYIRG
jgi:hypothetical protein